MAKTVLLPGMRADVREAAKQEPRTPGIEFLGGTSVAAAESAFSPGRHRPHDHWRGLDLEVRAATVRAVFQSSDGQPCT